jgi:xanthine dehydrogenase accessory factor
MLVDSSGVMGTIGGGNLEREAIATARLQLDDAAGFGPIHILRMTLGRDLAQCCGGVVELWLERVTRADLSWLAGAAESARAAGAVLVTQVTDGVPVRTCRPVDDSPSIDRIHLDENEHGAPRLRERIDVPMAALWLYGAGHVGRAIVRGLAELPFATTWIDSRAELLAGTMPLNTRARHTTDPVAVTREAPPTAWHLVMTHDHGLDFDVCHAVLARDEFSWLGLIGSASKAAKFRARLARAGIPAERIARLVCPIGVGGLTSKLPAAIAASVTVQLLQELEHVAERTLFQANEARAPAPAIPRHHDCPAEDCNACRARQGIYR